VDGVASNAVGSRRIRFKVWSLEVLLWRVDWREKLRLSPQLGLGQGREGAVEPWRWC
jgi:hypothetical protein